MECQSGFPRRANIMPKLYVKLDEEVEPQSGSSTGGQDVETAVTNSAPTGKTNVRTKVKTRVQDYQDNNENIIQLFHLSLVIVIFLALAVVFAQVGNFGWFFDTKPVDSGPINDVALALAPILALTLAIERLVETLFTYFEGNIGSVAKFSNLGTKYHKTMDTELRKATTEYKSLLEKLATVTEVNRQQFMTELDKVEEWVESINSRIGTILKDPRYVAFKQRMSIWLGFALGFIVAIMTDQGIFEYLQIGVPRIVDMVITGAVMGAGTGPMHSLVGVLDGLKTTLQNFKFQAATN
jgi:hypothetical protein